MNPDLKDFLKRKSRVVYMIAVLTACATFIVGAIRIASSKPQSPDNDSQSENRKQLIDLVPHHVPLKIKVKNLDDEKWVIDLGVEVTNTSDKPIYFLELWVTLPELVLESGRPLGFPLRYGRIQFVDFNTVPLPEDVPIQPGETYTFRIDEKYQRGWEGHQSELQNKPKPKKVHLKFVQLSFGDGTGFNGTDAKPYPYRRTQGSNSCREGPKDALGSATFRPRMVAAAWSDSTGSILPVVFVSGKSKYSSSAAPAAGPEPRKRIHCMRFSSLPLPRALAPLKYWACDGLIAT